ncbi:SAM-dependent methyltransferase [Promethearchaeum syntrophicum]|uniref:Ribosomal RNA large subunit methyltransferase E n=1 Tax=Promethearchaeum syntrophicum TaxID=2594042 RepID=A0A5B9D8B5_9ARCH|nr:RlmE family RNA methyltransferase [Candidatus Prometheoarchaeum syntrophicum]QEE15374.1 Ribosomal RNA large subunit methyltransferase E [Candidatus Prometheoarchaeum syntrophicum]
MAKKGKNWIKGQLSDKYYKKSKREGFRSRAAYKLLQIDLKYNIFKIKGKFPKKILDLGAAPGAWIEVIARKYLDIPLAKRYRNFKIIGIDLTTIRPFEDAPFIETHRVDIFSEQCENEIIQPEKLFDVILSDLAPKTSGDFRDIAKQEAMVEKVFEFTKYLKKHGNIVVKMFQSEFTNEIMKKWNPYFRTLKRMKPPASRESSRELYIVGLNFI